MQPSEFDEIFQQVRHAAGIFRTVFEDVTGEKLDLDSAIRHRPLLTLGVAAGAGAFAGWWFARRQQPALPPPPPPAKAATDPLGRSVEFLEEHLPGAVERVREALPEIVVSEEIQVRARGWVNNVLESPQMQRNMESLAENAQGMLGGLLRGLQRLDSPPDVTLDDPPSPEDEG